ncbi:Hemimethylated DNA-binding protein YccV like-domain-containing protein [Kalaharituber pfeilii]|nr:Hemimethylated DNA-binding protein YccV like-domain-containing protein [Kalaharituber pfeilii]
MDTAKVDSSNGSVPILTLPDEILQSIFSFVPDDSIFAVSQVCRRLYILSSLPIAWRGRCAKYQFWETHHAYFSKLKHASPSDVQWKRLFVRRYRSDKRVTDILNKIISSSTDMIDGFEQIAREGYDAKDCLKQHLEAPDDAEDVLARRYYASEALAFIHRRRAIEIWKKIGDGIDVKLEEALGAYDLFVTRGASRDVEQITRSLDALAAQFREEYPYYTTRSTNETASLLIAFMRKEGFVGANYENYHALRNSFIGICIDSSRATLPLTTVAVFCALGSRIGLDVKPCGFTYHVIAIVTDSDATKSPADRVSFWDPFKTHLEISRCELEDQLRALDMPASLSFLTPSNIRELIVRVARNILESVRSIAAQHIVTLSGINDMDRPPLMPERHTALYAALTASVICGPPASTRLLEHMCTLMQKDFYMDVGFFETDMARLISEDDAMMLHNICNAVRNEDKTPKKAMRRESAKPDPSGTGHILSNNVRYRVGTIFRHKRYDYDAVITGWTKNCATDENWIRHMQVDKLKRGRHQPFYNVFVADGSSRYVAEDNIIPLQPKEGHVLSNFLALGKYFKRFDENEGRFVSNLMDEYPDD